MSVQPGKPIPIMDEQALHAAEMEAEAALVLTKMTEPVRRALLGLLMAYRQVRKGSPLIMPADGLHDHNNVTTARLLCGETRTAGD